MKGMAAQGRCNYSSGRRIVIPEVCVTPGTAEVAGLVFLLIWFAVETLWDLAKSLVLPFWLVFPPVAAGVAYQLAFGEWYVASAMVAALLLHLSGKLPVRAAGTAVLITASAAAGYWALAAGSGLFWLLWEANIVGGADGLAAFAALMIAPGWEMFVALLAGIFLWGVGTMIVVYRGRLFDRLKNMVYRVALRNLPDEGELVKEGKPTLGGLWVGTVLFAAWRLLA
jgi:hypothetical protein